MGHSEQGNRVQGSEDISSLLGDLDSGFLEKLSRSPLASHTAFFLYFSFFVIVGLAVTIFDIPIISTAYIAKHKGEQLSPDKLFILDRFGGIFLSLCGMFATSILRIYTMQIRNRALLTRMLDKVNGQVSRVLHPLQSLAECSEAFDDCVNVVSTVAQVYSENTSSNHGMTIIRSLSSGYRRRFARVAKDLSDKGAFMDKEERRDLVNDILNVENTKSYIVIMSGVNSIASGPFQWHKEYLDQARAAGNGGNSGVWIYLPERADILKGANDKWNTTVVDDAKSVSTLTGMRCFVAPTFLESSYSEAFTRIFGDSLLVEIFSREIFEYLLPKDSRRKHPVPPPPMASFAWKATALYKGTGSGRLPRSQDMLTSQAAKKIAGDLKTTVWQCSEIATLIRAKGALVHEAEDMEEFLSFLRHDMTEVKG